VGVVVGIAAVVGVGWIVFSQRTTLNYAEEVAKPLETGLVETGGIKKCGTGDAGRGSDNRSPWYDVYYELPQGREKAIATINKIAEDNGYKLSHASLQNRGPVSVPDIFVGNWFYDTVGKPSPYQDLGAGKINLSFTINNDGPIELSDLSCKTDTPVVVNSDADTSAVSIRVGLPEFKR
jgi:hypothetical protein